MAGTIKRGAAGDMASIWGGRLIRGSLDVATICRGAVPDMVFHWGIMPLIGVCRRDIAFSLSLTGRVMRTDASGWVYGRCGPRHAWHHLHVVLCFTVDHVVQWLLTTKAAMGSESSTAPGDA